jgi:hypothetical protein
MGRLCTRRARGEAVKEGDRVKYEIGRKCWFVVDRDVPAPEFTPIRRLLPFDYQWNDRYIPGNWCRVTYEPFDDVVMPIIHAPRDYWAPSLESINEQI